MHPSEAESGDDVEVLGTARAGGSETTSWFAVAGFVAVGAIGVWAVATSPKGDEAAPVTTSSAVPDDKVLESPFWFDSASGVRVVDLGTLIDDSLDLPSSGSILAVRIDSASLPGEYRVESEFSLADPRRLVEEPVSYSQEIHASNADGATLFMTLRGTLPSRTGENASDQLALPTGWTPQPLRGIEGRVSGSAVAWIEPGAGLVTIRSTTEPIAEVLEIADVLVFAEGELGLFPFSAQAPAFEPTGAIVFADPDGEWVFDEIEVLIVNGRPGSTGRVPSRAVSEPIAVAVSQDNAAAVAGVAPARVTSIRVLTGAGQIAEIPTVESPANPANRLFAFGLDPRLAARSLELIDSEGLVVGVFELPPVFFPSPGANDELD